MTPIRRFGSGVIHFAPISDDEWVDVEIFGTPAHLAHGSFVATCGALLRGDLIRMRSFRPESDSCPRCRRDPAVITWIDAHRLNSGRVEDQRVTP